MATQLVSCAQGNCDQTDVQSFIGWAKDACAGVGVSFDASASGSSPTTTQNQATVSPIVSSPASTDSSPSSQATLPSSDSGSASSGGLDTSDKIAIGIGVPVGLATILATWVGWLLYRRNIKKSRNKVVLGHP